MRRRWRFYLRLRHFRCRIVAWESPKTSSSATCAPSAQAPLSSSSTMRRLWRRSPLTSGQGTNQTRFSTRAITSRLRHRCTLHRRWSATHFRRQCPHLQTEKACFLPSLARPAPTHIHTSLPLTKAEGQAIALPPPPTPPLRRRTHQRRPPTPLLLLRTRQRRLRTRRRRLPTRPPPPPTPPLRRPTPPRRLRTHRRHPPTPLLLLRTRPPRLRTHRRRLPTRPPPPHTLPRLPTTEATECEARGVRGACRPSVPLQGAKGANHDRGQEEL